MGKNSKAQSRKRARLEAVVVRTDIHEPDAGEDRIDGLDIYPDEVDTTVSTLNYLARRPDALKSKAFKSLRTAVYDVQRVHSSTTGAGASLTSRISSALIDGRHVDALVLLAELRIRNQQPKLGALQRWVRECDAASIGKGNGEIVWDVLEAILRTTSMHPTIGTTNPTSRASIRHHDPWLGGSVTGRDVWDTLQSKMLIDEIEKKRYTDTFKPLQTTPGSQRRPPNIYPAIIYFAPPNSIPLAQKHDQVTRHDAPNIPGAFLLTNVLSSDESTSIIKMAETIGLIADQPAVGSAASMTSVLAHNLIWLADVTFLSRFFSRIEHLLPQTIAGGGVRGVNARFRIYRYRPGALYRPHIDGAWPSSALAVDTTQDPPKYSYVYDSDPKLYSRLTLLIYLNDDFSGGYTTFFTPSTQGGLDAWPVRPVQGGAMVFPHGATEGSLLHEGSGVVEGAKYIIRTEVLYEVERDGGVESEL